MSLSVVATIVLELLLGRSTKIIQVLCLSNTGQGQSQQTALGSLGGLEANSSNLPRMKMRCIDFGKHWLLHAVMSINIPTKISKGGEWSWDVEGNSVC